MTHAKSQLSIRGKVSSVDPHCGEGKVMSWLSLPSTDFNKKLLLMHTLVPVKGSFEFFVLPGNYRVVVSTSKGCSQEKFVSISNKNKEIDFDLRIKK